jgi:hypothetical protein
MSESEMKEIVDKFVVWERRRNTPDEDKLMSYFKNNYKYLDDDEARYAFIAFIGGYFLRKGETE